MPRLSGKKQSFDEIVRNRAVVWLLGTAVVSVSSGFGAYPALLAISGRTTIESIRLNDLEKKEKENKELANQNDILKANFTKMTSGVNQLTELLQTGFWAYSEINLKQEKGESFDIGKCPSDKCYTFTVVNIRENKDAVDEVIFNVKGTGFDQCDCSYLAIPLIQGKKIGIASGVLDLNILVESDRISDIRLGVSVRDGSLEPDQKPKIITGGFVLDQPADALKFYKRWGFSTSELPFISQSNNDYKTRIKDAISVAAKSPKVLMVQFGANWCPDCLVLSKSLATEPVKSYFDEHFMLQSVDVGRFRKNIDIASDFGVNIAGGIPAAAFIFPDGTRIATTGLGELSNARYYDPADVLIFLKAIIDNKNVLQMKKRDASSPHFTSFN
jgi:thioredoxin 1